MISTNMTDTESNLLKDRFPDLYKSIDIMTTHTLLPTLNLDKLSYGSAKKIAWTCDKHPETSFISSVNNRTRGRDCSYCSGRQVLPGYNSLDVVRPDIAEEWSPRNTIKVSEVTVSSGLIVEWVCKDNATHVWNGRIANRTGSHRNCPYCVNQKVKPEDSLLAKQPTLCLSWDYDKNTVAPDLVAPGTAKSYWWKCQKGHSWQATVGNRVAGTECPNCKNHGTSKVESHLRGLLCRDSTALIVLPFGVANIPGITFTSGRKITADILGYSPVVGKKVVIEYDGHYHAREQNIERDIYKTVALLSNDYLVIRVRAKILDPLPLEADNLLQVFHYGANTEKSLVEIVSQIDEWLDSKEN